MIFFVSKLATWHNNCTVLSCSPYLQAVYATMDRAPTKKGKKRRAMKMVCIWAALPGRRGGWQLWVRLTWGGSPHHTHTQIINAHTQIPFLVHYSVNASCNALKVHKNHSSFQLKHYVCFDYNQKQEHLLRALNGTASKVIQHAHKTFRNPLHQIQPGSNYYSYWINLLFLDLTDLSWHNATNRFTSKIQNPSYLSHNSRQRNQSMWWKDFN